MSSRRSPSSAPANAPSEEADDPVLRALESAPLAEPLSREDLAILEARRKDGRAFVPHSHIAAMIEEWRRGDE
jgi:hypothetical protein